jgi:CheY-like chemotaxis protein
MDYTNTIMTVQNGKTHPGMLPRFNNVLLLDDSDVDNFIHKKLIKNSNFASSVHVITSAEKAIAHLCDLERRGGQAEELLPEVIFIDLNMPVMSGYEFIEKIGPFMEGILRNTRLVILTSSLLEQEKIASLSLITNVSYLIKPLTKEMLEEF